MKEDGTTVMSITNSRNITTNASDIELDCSGTLQLNSSGSTINIGNDNVAQDIDIGK